MHAPSIARLTGMPPRNQFDYKATQTMSHPNARPARLLSAGRQTALALFASALITGCSSVPLGSAAAPAAPEQASPQILHRQMQQLATRYGICGMALAVLERGQLKNTDAVQGCASAHPVGPDSAFEAASLSKPVFAYSVLKLVQQQKLALDAPVLSYLPQGYQHAQAPHLAQSPADTVSDPRLKAVTVRMALNHTTGLPNWARGPLGFSGEPGHQWQYSGEGYVLLQRAVEAVTQEDLDTFMTRQVFVPLGMTHSAYTHRSSIAAKLLPGTNRQGVARPPRPFGVPVSAFSLYTNAQDYGRFLAALLRDERTLRQIVESPVPVNARLGISWGLGWGVEQHGDERVLWHWGNNPGYRAFVMVSAQSGNGFVMFTNSDAGLQAARPLAMAVLPGPHAAFSSNLMGDSISNWLCDAIGLCL